MNKEINNNKNFFLWYYVYYMEKLIKRKIKENVDFKKLNLTPTEYFVMQYFIIHKKSVSFYKLRNLLPIDDRQLHLNITNLVNKGFLKREYIGKSSKIFIENDIKIKIENIAYSNQIDNISNLEDEEELLKLKQKIKILIDVIEFSI